MSFERREPVWPPPPRGAVVLDASALRSCDALEGLALLHVLGGLAWPVLVVGTTLLDRWLPGISASRYWCALLGPTIASWGLIFWFLVRYGMRRGQRWSCDAAIAAILAWLPLDFALCFAMQFRAGMVLDPAFGLLMLGLLFALRPRLPLS